jgi:hypothetical protein
MKLIKATVIISFIILQINCILFKGSICDENKCVEGALQFKDGNLNLVEQPKGRNIQVSEKIIKPNCDEGGECTFKFDLTEEEKSPHFEIDEIVIENGDELSLLNKDGVISDILNKQDHHSSTSPAETHDNENTLVTEKQSPEKQAQTNSNPDNCSDGDCGPDNRSTQSNKEVLEGQKPSQNPEQISTSQIKTNTQTTKDSPKIETLPPTLTPSSPRISDITSPSQPQDTRPVQASPKADNATQSSVGPLEKQTGSTETQAIKAAQTVNPAVQNPQGVAQVQAVVQNPQGIPQVQPAGVQNPQGVPQVQPAGIQPDGARDPLQTEKKSPSTGSSKKMKKTKKFK